MKVIHTHNTTYEGAGMLDTNDFLYVPGNLLLAIFQKEDSFESTCSILEEQYLCVRLFMHEVLLYL